jgi:hypothetical protein
VLFVFLLWDDIPDLRKGLTKFVDHRHIGDKTFNRVVISLHKNKREVEDLLAGLKGTEGKTWVEGQPQPGESICKGCKATMRTETLFEGKCIVCWATEAKAGMAANLNIKPAGDQ